MNGLPMVLVVKVVELDVHSLQRRIEHAKTSLEILKIIDEMDNEGGE